MSLPYIQRASELLATLLEQQEGARVLLQEDGATFFTMQPFPFNREHSSSSTSLTYRLTITP
eukprot:1878766-Prorocentrum_lima.AAC.1